VALLGALLLLDSVHAQTAPPPRLEPVRDCFVPPPDDIPDGVEVACGYLVVPERRDGGPQQTIQLAYMRYRTAAPTPGDPLIYLAGGPGDSGIENIASAGPLVRALLLTRDLIAFDQRGTGYSLPLLTCAEWEAAAETASAGAAAPAPIDELAGCRAYWTQQGVDLAAYTTGESAADVADLLAALGYRRGVLLGASYGSKLALVMLRHHPDQVAAAVLDGAVPVELNQEVEQVAKVDYAFERVFALCAADQACDAFYPDLERRFYAQVARLDRDPLTLTLSVDGERQEEPLDGMALVNGLFIQLFDGRRGVEEFPYRLAQVEQGDTTYLAQLYSDLAAIDPFSGDGLYNTVHCGEEVLLTTPAALQASAGRFPRLAAALQAHGPETLTGVFDECAAWGTPAAGVEYATAVTSNLPVLIFQGGLDFQTPMPWARQLQAALPDSRLIYLPTAGHVTSLDDVCVAGLVAQFAADPAADLDSSCVAELPALHFYAPALDLTELGRAVLVQGGAGEQRIATLVPASWWPVELGEPIYLAPDAGQSLSLLILDDRRSLRQIAYDLAGITSGALETWTMGDRAWEVLATPATSTWTGVYALHREGEAVYVAALEGFFLDQAAAIRTVLRPALAAWRSGEQALTLFQPVSFGEDKQTLHTVVPPAWAVDPSEAKSYTAVDGSVSVKADLLSPAVSVPGLARTLTRQEQPEIRRLVVGMHSWSLFADADAGGWAYLYALTQDRQGTYGFRLRGVFADIWREGGDLLYPMLAAFRVEQQRQSQ
jgi:pimeloyl-ACP methyl ester carboxylesterase